MESAEGRGLLRSSGPEEDHKTSPLSFTQPSLARKTESGSRLEGSADLLPRAVVTATRRIRHAKVRGRLPFERGPDAFDEHASRSLVPRCRAREAKSSQDSDGLSPQQADKNRRPRKMAT